MRPQSRTRFEALDSNTCGVVPHRIPGVHAPVITHSVRQTASGLGPRLVLVVGLAVAVGTTPLPCRAIEMFTFFGDGSRIGLPSLEVPVEAYSGIPLRSDRLRARRVTRTMPGTNVTARPVRTPGFTTVPVIPEGEVSEYDDAAAVSPPRPAATQRRPPPMPPMPPAETIPVPAARGAAVLNRQHPS
jgi:hypothetical protein